MSDDHDDDAGWLPDPFDGDEDFAAVLEGQRSWVETRTVVSDLDAQWFAENPKHKRRIRLYVPGEFDNESGGSYIDDAPPDLAVLVSRSGFKSFFPIGGFDKRGWKAGGL